MSFTDKTKSAIPFVKYASSIAIVTSAPSIPHTVRFPVWAKKLQARPQNVRNDGAVNSGAEDVSSLISETGRVARHPGASA